MHIYVPNHTHTHLNTSTQRRKTASFSLVQRYTHVPCLFEHGVCVCVCVEYLVSHSASVFVLLPYCSAAQNSSPANWESAQQTFTTPDLQLSQGLLRKNSHTRALYLKYLDCCSSTTIFNGEQFKCPYFPQEKLKISWRVSQEILTMSQTVLGFAQIPMLAISIWIQRLLLTFSNDQMSHSNQIHFYASIILLHVILYHVY